MTKTFASRLAVFASGLLISFSAFAAGGGATLQAGNDLSDRASLQRGAQLYMNYCAGCHSLKYMRYSRMAEDLGLTEDEVMKNLNFTGAKFGEQVQVSMPAAGGEKWFGKMPPDLSVISRVRGSDWIYTYLKSFYLDESRPLGWNNKLFPNASMPNPLWELQGLQHAEFGPVDPATGERHVEGLKVAQAGRQSAPEFDQTARDITNFLEYVGEPAALKRQSIGVWVILFLAALTFLAYLLKQEYWKDVH
ncbi:cytochrome c1 [Pseudoxanthomonas mexicana]|uniref:cytochrome c1 n=1 Tax=Pseudoxanthomonas mexicana TaxID=128785 RepID=UPI001FD66A71|nr:cytochrome c1 [Pseudoxanthomonas mexicana]UOV02444.1 cytochrome c1 [Pseudoxanthomonas mexicana]